MSVDSPNRTFKITIEPEGKMVESTGGETLRSVLRRAGYFFPQNCGGKGQCGYCRVEFLSATPAMLPRERELLGDDNPYRLACLHKIRSDCSIALPLVQEWESEKVITGFEADGAAAGYGIAADLGTTFIALYLVDLSSGEIGQQYSFLNPQVHHGGDVMTRLEQARDAEMRVEFTALARQAILEGIDTIADRAGIHHRDVTRIVLAGNTAMIHFFLGRGGDGLEVAPFQSPLENQGIISFDPGWIGLTEHCRCEISPVLGGFIGGDTAAGIIATDLDRCEGSKLLLDLGTNGEVVLSTQGTIRATSTAAGPAFEGVGMHNGMPALKGAIEGFHESGEPFVIGGGEPLGFCGSGYISAMAMLLRTGVMNAGGLLAKDSDGIRQWSPLPWRDSAPSIIQDDVRKFQLAKGAVAAGIEILCREAGVNPDDLEEIIITGSFGNRIDPKATIEIGLIPRVSPDKIRFLDNAAGRGAILCLGEDSFSERARQLPKSVKIVNLGDHPKFQEIFIANMPFPAA